MEVLPREYGILEMAVKREWYGLIQPDIGVVSAGLRVKEIRKSCLISRTMLDTSLMSLGAAQNCQSVEEKLSGVFHIIASATEE